MCEAKFTEGDWKILDGYQVGIDVEFGDGFFTIASCQVFSEGKANANLIAAAPEMYEALERIVELLTEEEPYTLGWLEMHTSSLTKLLAKARGENA